MRLAWTTWILPKRRKALSSFLCQLADIHNWFQVLIGGKIGCVGSRRVPFAEVVKLSKIAYWASPWLGRSAALEPDGKILKVFLTAALGVWQRGLEFARGDKILKGKVIQFPIEENSRE